MHQKTDAKSWCKSYNHNNGKGLPFYLTSAKDNINVNNGFRKIAKLAMFYNDNVLKKEGIKFNTVDLNRDNNNNSNKKDCKKCQLL